MDPDQIIKHVSYYYRQYWSGTCGLNRSQFEKVIAPWWQSKLHDWQFSRLRGPDKTPTALIKLLAVPEAREAIARALKCPLLFTCASETEIDAMLAPLVSRNLVDEQASASDSLLVPNRTIEDFGLSKKEKLMVSALTAFMMKPRGYVALWPDPPRPGGALLAYAVAGNLRQTASIPTYLARPFANACATYLGGFDASAGEVPYESALRALAQELGLHVNATPQALLDRMAETNSALFVLHADCLESAPRDRSSFMHRLILEAKERFSRRATKSYPMVLVGTPRDEKLAAQSRRFNEKHGRYVLFNSEPPEDASTFFEAQWRRYCEKRGYRLDAEAGSSRLKRVRDYYISEDVVDAWPATLRLHAFFASNYRTFTYFDPTAGWTRMTGMDASGMPIDIALHLDEVVQRLRFVDQNKKRWPTMRAVRWCSTALYWLTSGAAAFLGKANEPKTDLSTFHSAVSAEEGLIEVTTGKDGSPIYKMDLAARAAVQERWMHKDSRGRAEAHRLIAERLLASMNDKELLGVCRT